MEITYENIKTNILKIIISRDNERLSQQQIYDRLLEIYKVSSDGINTRSKNNFIKTKFTTAILHYKYHKDILFSVDSGVIYLQYHEDINNEDKEFDNDEYCESSDEDDELYDPEDYDESNYENDDVVKDIFENMMNNIPSNVHMIESFSDSFGLTVSHHLVRDVKYKKLITKLDDAGLFHYDIKSKCGQTPIDLVCDKLKSQVNEMYTKRIVESKLLNYYLKDEIKKIMFRNELMMVELKKSNKNQQFTIKFIINICMLNIVIMWIYLFITMTIKYLLEQCQN